jgi:hypothetical protein
MSLTSYRAAPPRVILFCPALRLPKQKGRLKAARSRLWAGFFCDEKLIFCSHERYPFAFSRPGSDLLSRVLRRSTIGAGAFHGRVRNGNGCSHPARTTRSAKGKCSCRWHEHLFPFSLANLSCSLVARKGAKAVIRERMNMPCA